jgi:uncharacterized membrane protein
VKRLLVIPLVFLAGCSSPADVEKTHRDAESIYQQDLARAQEWNTHVLGIPSSGWLTILILSILSLLTLVILAGVWAYRVQERRASDRRTRMLAENELNKELLRRGNCWQCGADPAIAAAVKKSVSERK